MASPCFCCAVGFVLAFFALCCGCLLVLKNVLALFTLYVPQAQSLPVAPPNPRTAYRSSALQGLAARNAKSVTLEHHRSTASAWSALLDSFATPRVLPRRSLAHRALSTRSRAPTATMHVQSVPPAPSAAATHALLPSYALPTHTRVPSRLPVSMLVRLALASAAPRSEQQAVPTTRWR